MKTTTTHYTRNIDKPTCQSTRTERKIYVTESVAQLPHQRNTPRLDNMSPECSKVVGQRSGFTHIIINTSWLNLCYLLQIRPVAPNICMPGFRLIEIQTPRRSCQLRLSCCRAILVTLHQ